MASYKLLTLNRRGLNNPVKRRWLVTALHKEYSDIVFLQETHIKQLTSRILNSNRFLYQFHAPGSSKAQGLAILFSKDLQFSALDVLADSEGRFLFLNCMINEVKYTLVSLYAPNNNQLLFFNQTLHKLETFKIGNVLLGGDLNHI